MVDPHVVITVRDSAGKLLEAIQESPQLICYPSDADKFSLGFSWHLQTPVNCLPEGAAVFAELRHYKPDKKKVCGVTRLSLHVNSIRISSVCNRKPIRNAVTADSGRLAVPGWACD